MALLASLVTTAPTVSSITRRDEELNAGKDGQLLGRDEQQCGRQCSSHKDCTGGCGFCLGKTVRFSCFVFSSLHSQCALTEHYLFSAGSASLIGRRPRLLTLPLPFDVVKMSAGKSALLGKIAVMEIAVARVSVASYVLPPPSHPSIYTPPFSYILAHFFLVQSTNVPFMNSALSVKASFRSTKSKLPGSELLSPSLPRPKNQAIIKEKAAVVPVERAPTALAVLLTRSASITWHVSPFS